MLSVRLRALIGGVAASALLLAGCTEPEPLRIGFLAGLSGRSAELGIAGRNGAQLAIETANRNGGIGGRRILLVVKDDAHSPEQAAKAMREFSQAGVKVIVGPMTSAIALAALPVAEELGMLLVSPTATTHLLSGKDDRFVRVVSATDQYARRNAEYLLARTPIRRVAVLQDSTNLPYTASWLEVFRRHFEPRGAGGRAAARPAGKARPGPGATPEIVEVLDFASGDTGRLREIVGRALAHRPDALLLLAGAVDAALLAQHARSLSPQTPLITSEWAATERFLELAGPAGEGAVGVQFIDRGSTAPGWRAFRDTFVERFAMEPGFAGLAAHDAAQLAMRGLAASPADPRQGMLGVDGLQGLQGSIAIDAFGDAQRPAYITQVVGGKFQVVE